MNRVENRLAAILHRGWWLLLLRGIVAIAFGVLTWMQPGISAAALVLLFGALRVRRRRAQHVDRDRGTRGPRVLVALAATRLARDRRRHPRFRRAGRRRRSRCSSTSRSGRSRPADRDRDCDPVATRDRGRVVADLVGARVRRIRRRADRATRRGALALLWLIATFAVAFGVVLVILAFKARGFARRVAA